MEDNRNTIAGWVLAGGIAALGLSIISGKYFHADEPERPEKLGYVIEGVVSSDEGAAKDEVPFATVLASADPAKGEKVFAKCTACHSIAKGGASGIGPNLWSVVGKPHGHLAGFAYSDALKSVPGNWTFDALNEWLTAPAKYAPGTKMTFAGLSKVEDRANVIAYLNQNSDSPQPLPAAPAAAPAAAEGDAAAPAEGEAAPAPAEGTAPAAAPAS